MLSQYKIALLLLSPSVSFSNDIECSIFFTPEQIERSENPSSSPVDTQNQETFTGKRNLVLGGIMINPVTNEWIIWINGQKIDSTESRIIDGWIISSVSHDTVELVSPGGEKKVLKVE